MLVEREDVAEDIEINLVREGSVKFSIDGLTCQKSVDKIWV